MALRRIFPIPATGEMLLVPQRGNLVTLPTSLDAAGTASEIRDTADLHGRSNGWGPIAFWSRERDAGFVQAYPYPMRLEQGEIPADFATKAIGSKELRWVLTQTLEAGK